MAIDTGDVARYCDLAANGANLSGHVPSLVMCAVLGGQPKMIDCLRELNAPMGTGVPKEDAPPLALFSLHTQTATRGSGDPDLVIAVGRHQQPVSRGLKGLGRPGKRQGGLRRLFGPSHGCDNSLGDRRDAAEVALARL